MRKLLYVTAILLSSGGIYAQNEEDALRYTQQYFGGTARNMSMAGSMSALGGDYSNVLTNPAGLARFKRSNFSTTMSLENPNSTSTFMGTNTTERGLAAKFNSISYIKAYNLDPNKFSNWFGVTMGLGYNRIRSFEDRFRYTGTADSSIIHSFINEANGTLDTMLFNSFPFGAALAYEVFAMDPELGSSNTYTTEFNAGQAIHDREVIRRGGMSEYNFSLAGNYANKLFIGGSFNVTRVNYSEFFDHNETYTVDSLWLNSTRYTGDLDIKGWGYSARLGVIFLPTDWIRLGIAAQTPTVYYMRDQWSNNMWSNTDDPTNPDKFIDPAFVPTGSYNYKVRTPFRANASLGLVFKKFGSIGAEVEFVDYSGASLADKRFSPAPYSFATENTQIENLYRSVFNYKLGVEARVTKQAYVRGGFAYFPSHFRESSGNFQYPSIFYTGGLGYNFGKFYIDAAVVMRSQKQDYYAYDPAINGSRAELDIRNGQYLLTFGIRIE